MAERQNRYKYAKEFYIPEDGTYDMTPVPMMRMPRSNLDIFHIVTKEEQFNPDLIAKRVYGDEKKYYLILSANDILDPFTELYAGRAIRIPSRYIVDLISTI